MHATHTLEPKQNKRRAGGPIFPSGRDSNSQGKQYACVRGANPLSNESIKHARALLENRMYCHTRGLRL